MKTFQARECPECGEWFAPGRPQIYCSRVCQVASHKRRKARAEPTPEDKLCLDRIIAGFCDGHPALMREFREGLTNPRKFAVTLAEIRASVR